MTRAAEVAPPRAGILGSLSQVLGRRTYDIDPLSTRSQQIDSTLGWVWSTVSMIAADVSLTPWTIFDTKGSEEREDWDTVPKAKLPRELLEPMPGSSLSDQIEFMQLHLDLTGGAFWHLLRAKPGGRALGMQWLSPAWLQEDPVWTETSPRRVLGWRVISSGVSANEILPMEDVVTTFYPNPRSPYAGTSPLRMLGTSYNMDAYIRAYVSSFLEEGSWPTGVLTVKERLKPVEAKRYAEAFAQSHQGRQEVAVLSGEAKFQEIGSKISDLDLDPVVRAARDMIFAMYNVPASRFGLQEDANRASGTEADRVYYGNSIGPRHRRWERTINSRILPEFGLEPGRFIFEFDTPDVQDEAFELDRAERSLRSGALSLNGFRAATGQEPLSEEDGEIFLIPAGFSLERSPADAIGRSAAPPPGGAPPQNEPPEPEGPESGTPAGDGADEDDDERLDRTISRLGAARERARAAEEEPSVKRPSLEAQRAAVASFLRSQERLERKLLSKLRSLFSREQKAVLRALRKSGKLEGLIDPPKPEEEPRSVWGEPAQRGRGSLIDEAGSLSNGGDEAGSLSMSGARSPMSGLASEAQRRGVFDDVLDDLLGEWEEAIERGSFESFEEGFALFEENVGVGISFEISREAATDYAKAHAAEFVKHASKATKDRLRALVVDAVSEGQSVQQLAKRISETYDRWKAGEGRANVIARTESAGAINAGELQHAEDFNAANDDVRMTKTWLPTQDDRTRPSHRAASIRPSDTIPLEDAFTIGGQRMMRPLDPEGGAAEVIQCRCTLTFDVSEEG